MSLSGDKGVAQFKKSVKMGHPNDHADDDDDVITTLRDDHVDRH